MESEVRNAVMVGVVLIALSVVILIGFAAFSIARNTASDGSQNIQNMVSDFSDIEFKTYDDVEVLGRDVLNTFTVYKNDNLAILIHTNKMNSKDVVVSRTSDRYILYYEELPFINLGSILSIDSSSYDIKDTNKIEKNTRLSIVAHKKENLYDSPNGSGLMSDGLFCIDNEGKIIKDDDLGSLKTKGTCEYINPTTRFNSRLVRDYNNEIIGLCFLELD